MPEGLDGNPNPIRTTERDAVLTAVADRVCTHGSNRLMVGIDSRSGAGKSTFADELARLISQRDRLTIRSTTASFHRPRRERLKRGATSAEGYYFDSHQLDRILNELLIPFRQGADDVLIAAFDEQSDTALETKINVDSSAVLVFDGPFLHRPEFVGMWDVSVFLEADQRRDREWLQFLLDDLPAAPTEQAAELDRRLEVARWPRYRQGWVSYVREVAPINRATFAIDNNDLARPRLLDS